MIDGIDYFPKREKYKKGADQEWNELKKIKTDSKKNKIKQSPPDTKGKKNKPV